MSRGNDQHSYPGPMHERLLTKGNKMADNRWYDDGGNADMTELPEAIANLSNVNTVDTKEVLAIAILSQSAGPEEDDNEPDAACKLDDEADD